MKTVTRDSGANVKILRALERAGLIQVTDVLLENGRTNKKFSAKEPAIFVIGHSHIGECVIAANHTPHSRIREIIGRDPRHVKDAMHLETHLRLGHDYIVTEDSDFLSKKDILCQEFECEIVTPDELREMLTDPGNSGASATATDASASSAPSPRSAGSARGSPKTAGRPLRACGRCSSRSRSASAAHVPRAA